MTVRVSFTMDSELRGRPADDGHLIGNHSYYHVPMDLLTDAGIHDPVARAEEGIRAVTGSDTRPWFRCTYGAGEGDWRVLGLLSELGNTNVTRDFETDDWADGRDADELIAGLRDAGAELVRQEDLGAATVRPARGQHPS